MRETWRLFVAIDLDHPARQALRSAQEAARRLDLPARWVDPAGAHLTVRFLGETDRALIEPLADALRAVTARYPPFSLRTGAVGAFPDPRHPRIVWLGLVGALDQLLALRRDVDGALAALGIPAETRPFRPHLTLGRLSDNGSSRTALSAATLAALAPRAAPLPVMRLVLMRSALWGAAPRYTIVRGVPLTGRPLRG